MTDKTMANRKKREKDKKL